MNYAERLENVTVLGAAGKMGSGIVLLTLMEMADLSLDPQNKNLAFALNAVDISQTALTGLLGYLRSQIRRAAEKKTVLLRKAYEGREDLVENEEIINQYIEDALAILRPTTRTEAADDSRIVFEAVNENLDLKLDLLSGIKSRNKGDVWFLTNTSSLPISELNEKVGLDGRIIGFHFYNPPAVQKLVELIRAESTVPELAEFALELAKRLRKTVVPSNDVAGFIGNGHFMRDALYGISEVERLAKDHGFVDAVHMINRVSQEFLIRPMGIFQLIDYVGLDICQCIMKVMDERLPGEKLASPLLDRMIEAGILGGQRSDGSQKDGFLKYEKGRPQGVYDPEAKTYVSIADISGRADGKLGTPPSAIKPWKTIIGSGDKATLLETYFLELKGMTTLGSELALAYGRKSREIGLGLVKNKVAANPEDVNAVLLTGFFHAYGPINGYFD